jgi:hypothetical protein
VDQDPVNQPNERSDRFPAIAFRVVLYASIMVGLVVFLLSPSGTRVRHEIHVRCDKLFGRKIVERFPRYKMDMSSIESAIETYTSYYNHFPQGMKSLAFETDNGKLMEVLMGSGNNEETVKQNPNRIKFIFVSEVSLKDGRFLDPWGHPYHIAFDPDATGKVTVGNLQISNRIAIWSDGPNGTNEYGKGDDVCNWK